MDYFDKQKLRRANAYPTEEEALAVMHDAYARLCDLGWRPPVYFQHHRDSTAPIASVVAGSPLVHYSEGRIQPNALLWKEKEPPRLNRAFTRAARRIDTLIALAFVITLGL